MATSTSSISGLVSGLDTASIIDQLMQLEAVPQARLAAQQIDQKKVLAALQSINTDVSLLGSNAATLADPKTWSLLKATSSNSAVTATVRDQTKATSTGFDVTVNQTAVAHQLSFDFKAATTDVVTTGQMRLDFTDPSKSPIILSTDGTLQGLADAINDPTKATGLNATVVRTGTDTTTGNATYGLVVTAAKTGSASQFTLTYDDAGGSTAGSTLTQQVAKRTGTDAQITMGTGLTLTSSTNTFTDITPGVDLTISSSAVGTVNLPTGATATSSTITVANDSSSVKSAVSALVDQLNKVLDSIDTQSANSTTTAAAGVLSGDSTVRDVRSALAESIFGSDNSSMSTYGIQTDKYGKLVFDGAAFDKAFAADPTDVMNHFTSAVTNAVAPAVNHPDGWAARVVAVTKAASDSVTGTITTDITGTNSTIDELTKGIAEWDDRLALRRTTLQQQYTALETALSSLQSQGQWLAGQIAHLPTSSS